MARRSILSLMVAALAAGAGSAAPPAARYAIETGVAGVVDLYDLSSVTRVLGGFSIVEVVASRHFPTVFGPVAYRVSRETYHCGKSSYEVSALREYRRDGTLLDSMPGQRPSAMRLVARTASSEMYNRFCRSGAADALAGLAPVRIVTADSRFAAYRIGRAMLTGSP